MLPTLILKSLTEQGKLDATKCHLGTTVHILHSLDKTNHLRVHNTKLWRVPLTQKYVGHSIHGDHRFESTFRPHLFKEFA